MRREAESRVWGLKIAEAAGKRVLGPRPGVSAAEIRPGSLTGGCPRDGFGGLRPFGLPGRWETGESREPVRSLEAPRDGTRPALERLATPAHAAASLRSLAAGEHGRCW